jgi:hypothetical protein
MAFKINVGLSRKIGQPNFGSLGASCHIDLEIDPQTASLGPDAIQQQILAAFAVCKQSVDTELAQCDKPDTHATVYGFHPAEQPSAPRRQTYQPPASDPSVATTQRQPRPATAAQIKALHTIASRSGLTLASELQQQYGLTNPQQLTIQQASHMIDHLKQSLTPTPA